MRDSIYEIIKKICPTVTMEQTANMLGDGIVDSIDIIEIISSIQEELVVEIPYEEFTFDNMNSLDSMVALVNKYKK